MAYLIARKRESHGCLALKIKHGENLVELKRRLNKAVGYKGIELITISRPTAYVESMLHINLSTRSRSLSSLLGRDLIKVK